MCVEQGRSCCTVRHLVAPVDIQASGPLKRNAATYFLAMVSERLQVIKHFPTDGTCVSFPLTACNQRYGP